MTSKQHPSSQAGHVLSSQREQQGHQESKATTEAEKTWKSEHEELLTILPKMKILDTNPPNQPLIEIRHSDQTDWTSQSIMSKATDTDTSYGRQTPRKRKKTRRKRVNRSMSNPLNKYRETFQQIVQCMTNPNVEESLEKLLKLIKTMSKAAVAKALKSERNLLDLIHYTNTIPIIKPPNLEENERRDIKTLRDATQTFKDIVSIKILNTSSIHTSLKLASDIATHTKLSSEQLYYLLMSRAPQNSLLRQEILYHHLSDTPIKDLYQQLSILFSSGSSYLDMLKEFEDFNGKGMSCPNFISSLKTLTTNLVKVSHIPENQMADFTLQKIREKVYILFPTLAPRILEKDLASRNGGKEPGTLIDFQELLMTYAPLIEALLQKPMPKKVNMIKEEEKGSKTETTIRPPRITKSGQAPYQHKPLRLTKNQLTLLKHCCFKCGGKSILNPEKHRGLNCLLYEGEPLASNVCNNCEQAVHLPKFCKARLEDQIAKAKELGIQLKLGSMPIHLIESDKEAEETLFLKNSQIKMTNFKTEATTRPLRLTKEQLNLLKHNCYKCGGKSILNPEKHQARNCLLYGGEELAFSVCPTCEHAVHLPKSCKARYEDQLAKAKELGIKLN